MKQAIRFLAKIYPAAWRDRYGREFDALLDDVEPTWLMLFDVLLGATKMQMKTWKTVASFAVIGMLAAIAFSWMTPDRYVSAAVLNTNVNTRPLERAALNASSRSSLTSIINLEGLYPNDRQRMPIEDLVEKMKKDIVLAPAGDRGVAVSFAYPDPAKAQKVTEHLVTSFVDVATVLDPATLPSHPQNPPYAKIVLLGTIAGTAAGALFALLRGLKILKLATALGLAGAVLCGGIALAIPSQYTSRAVVRLESPDRNFPSISSDATLDAIVTTFGLYPNDSNAREKLRQHLRIQPLLKAPALMVSFEYTQRFLSQRVTQDVVSRLIDESGNMEMLDPASLPLDPTFPNRPIIAGTGLAVGLALAIALGLRCHRLQPVSL